MTGNRWLQPVLDSCASFSMVIANLVWLFRVLYGIWFFWLVLDGSCTLWPYMWFLFQFYLDLYAAWWLWPNLDGSAQLKKVLPLFDGFCKFIMALDSSPRCSRRFWPVQNSCCCFWMVLSGFIFLLMVLFGVGLFRPFTYGSCRFSSDPSFLFTSFYFDLDAVWWFWTVLDGFFQFKIVVAASQWLRWVQCIYWWFCSVLDLSGLLKMVVLGSGKTFNLSSQVSILT